MLRYSGARCIGASFVASSSCNGGDTEPVSRSPANVETDRTHTERYPSVRSLRRVEVDTEVPVEVVVVEEVVTREVEVEVVREVEVDVEKL